VRTRRAEDDPDHRRAGDADGGDLERVLQPLPELGQVVADELPVDAGEKVHE
jgi:hypothetical protein